jgi:hypothetical protein
MYVYRLKVGESTRKFKTIIIRLKGLLWGHCLYLVSSATTTALALLLVPMN